VQSNIKRHVSPKQNNLSNTFSSPNHYTALSVDEDINVIVDENVFISPANSKADHEQQHQDSGIPTRLSLLIST